MGYVEKEQSLISGEPIELYRFKKGDQFWTFNDSNVSIIYNGKIYDPALIRRGDIELTSNCLKNLLKIEVDKTNKFAVNFISTPIEGITELTIYRGHGVDPANFIAYWKGSVFSVQFKPKIVIIVASPKTNSLKRSGLMRKYQRSCSYVLYSTRCTMVKANYKREGTIISIDGTKIEAIIFGTEVNGWFINGLFEIDSRSRMIVWHEGNYIRLMNKIQGLKIGDSFDAYAGCNSSATMCQSAKFNNKINYGGQEFIPDKNPFVGDPISI